jgi:hypothetical protein
MIIEDYENREFMIFEVIELPLIDFTQICETSEDTVRLSIDGIKTFVKWDSENIPSSVEALKTKEGPYTYKEMLIILKGPQWTQPNPFIYE